ncbi:hypothetical protein [Streptomyces sp. NPDC046261]|uniref:hypothetical protein n=1 Tax=Streptomyces sp. NPDC046261 TaxID=3157200 RepID=UPI0033C5D12D
MALKDSIWDAVMAATSARKAANAAEKGDKDAVEEAIALSPPRFSEIDWSTAGLGEGESRGTVAGEGMLEILKPSGEDQNAVKAAEEALSAAIEAAQAAAREVLDAMNSGDPERIKAANAKARAAGDAAQREAFRVDNLLKDPSSGLADAEKAVNEWWTAKQADAKEAYDQEGSVERNIHAKMTNDAAKREKSGGGEVGDAVTGVLGAGSKWGKKG